MWKVLCLGIGFLVGSLATVGAYVACLARLDSASELDYVVNGDVIIGGMFAFAFLLLAAPSLPGASAKWYAAVAATGVVIWAGVSGTLIWQHEEQVRIRSIPPVASAGEQ